MPEKWHRKAGYASVTVNARTNFTVLILVRRLCTDFVRSSETHGLARLSQYIAADRVILDALGFVTVSKCNSPSETKND